MKQVILLGAFALCLVLGLGTAAQAQCVVKNDGFEVGDSWFYAIYGNLNSLDYGVGTYDITAPGVFSYGYWQSPADSYNGGLQQTVYVIAGLTYDVSIDICYSNC